MLDGDFLWRGAAASLLLLPRQRPKCIYATQACERESSMNNAAATAARNIRTDALILNDVETFMAVSEHFWWKSALLHLNFGLTDIFASDSREHCFQWIQKCIILLCTPFQKQIVCKIIHWCPKGLAIIKRYSLLLYFIPFDLWSKVTNVISASNFL